MSFGIKLLDCTLRDGAYVVDGVFGKASMKGIIDKLQSAKIDIIECGWLKNNDHVEGTSYFKVPDDVCNYITNKKKNIVYTAMIDWNRYDVNKLPFCDGKSIDAIRVVFPREHYKEGIAVGKEILAKGYKVFYQAANTLAYSDEELMELAEEVNKTSAEAISIVDTFGAMFEDDLERIVSVLDKHLNSNINIGFHSHNNQQLSFALSMCFIKLLNGTQRECIIDSSLCGMGRGAGNTTTELMVSYLNKKHESHYDLDAIMDAIDIYMPYFKENYEWGYSTPYFIAGMYGAHVNNIAYLIKNHRTSAKNMRNIIESMKIEDRTKYDYDLLEEKYLANKNHYVDDGFAMDFLSQMFADKKILLVAPGKSALLEREKIVSYTKSNDVITIGVNAIVPGYEYDYLFFVNGARYEYAQKAYPGQFTNTKRIVSSSIKTVADDGEYIVAYNRLIKRGWEYYDNAMICALRFMNSFNIEKIVIAGFDGFKSKYNESYADEFLPTINPMVDWENLNKEIKFMYKHYKENLTEDKDVEFLTHSIFKD